MPLSRQNEPRLGWHSRGYLPHFDGGELAQFITFRLYDSLPREVLIRGRKNQGSNQTSQSHHCYGDVSKLISIKLTESVTCVIRISPKWFNGHSYFTIK